MITSSRLGCNLLFAYVCLDLAICVCVSPSSHITMPILGHRKHLSRHVAAPHKKKKKKKQMNRMISAVDFLKYFKQVSPSLFALVEQTNSLP